MAKSRVLLLWGGYYHDFQAAAGIIWNFLKPFDRYEVTATDDRKSLERLDPFDAVILYTQGGKPTPAEENGILNFVRRGGGLLGIHCASDTFRESERFIEMLGGRFTSHSPTHEFEVKASSTENFLNQRLRPFRITDELYVLEKFDPKKSTVAATTFWQGKDVPMAYTKGYGKGRVAYLGLGHQPSSFRNPGFQKLFLRALDWVTKNDRPKPKGLSVGIVGYGGAYCMGRHHIENMTKTGVFEAKAICDIDPERLRQAKRDFPDVKTFTSLEAMLSKAALDMCVVILPHNLHAETCVACLEAGKHVVCEKPMAITTEECTRMIEAARKAKRTLSIYQSRRYDAHYYMLKELLASGVIGQVFHLESFVGGYAHPGFTWRSDKAISGGALHDWGAHLVDWSFGLVGEKATSVTGFFHKRFWLGVTNDDEATGVIRFESGAEARVTVSNLEAGPRPFWVIQGTSGTIVMPDWETIKVYHATTVGKAETTLKVTPHSWFTDWSTYYFDLADHLFLGDRDPCSGEEGRRNIAIIEAAERSSKSGQSVAPAYHY